MRKVERKGKRKRADNERGCGVSGRRGQEQSMQVQCACAGRDARKISSKESMRECEDMRKSRKRR